MDDNNNDEKKTIKKGKSIKRKQEEINSGTSVGHN